MVWYPDVSAAPTSLLGLVTKLMDLPATVSCLIVWLAAGKELITPLEETVVASQFGARLGCLLINPAHFVAKSVQTCKNNESDTQWLNS